MPRNRHKNKTQSHRSLIIHIGSHVKVIVSPYDSVPAGTLAKVVNITGPWNDKTYILNTQHTAFKRWEIVPA